MRSEPKNEKWTKIWKAKFRKASTFRKKKVENIDEPWLSAYRSRSETKPHNKCVCVYRYTICVYVCTRYMCIYAHIYAYIHAYMCVYKNILEQWTGSRLEILSMGKKITCFWEASAFRLHET